MSKRDLLFVLGPPGTAAARVRDALLLATGRKISGKKVDQDASALALDAVNACLIEKLGLDPDAPQTVSQDYLRSQTLREDRVAARKALFSLNKDDFPLIYTHPLAATLLPFWQGVVDDTDVRLLTCLVAVNPLQTLDEAAAPDDADTDQHDRVTTARWTQSMFHALRDADKDTGIIAYRDLLTEPERTLNQAMERLPEKWRMSLAENIRKIDEKIIEPNRDGLAYSNKDLQDADPIPDFVKTLYADLLKASDPAQDFLLDDVLEAFSASSEIDFFLSAFGAATRHNQRLAQRVKALETDVRTLTSLGEQSKLALEKAEASRQSLLSENRSLTGKISTLTAEVAAAKQSNNEQLGILSEKNEALSRTLEENDQALAHLQTLLEQNRLEFTAREKDLTAEAARLSQQAEAELRLAKEMKRERAQDQQRFNMERASWIKQQRQTAKDYQDLVASLRTGVMPALPAEKKDPAAPLQPTVQSSPRQAGDEALPAALKSAQDRVSVLDADKTEAEKRALKFEQDKIKSEARAREAERMLIDQEARLAEIQLEAQSAREEVDALKQSTSWKISAPVRGVKTAMASPRDTVKSIIKRPRRASPPTAQKKSNLNGFQARTPASARAIVKTGLFTTLPFLFSGTGAYQRWRLQKTLQTPAASARSDQSPALKTITSPTRSSSYIPAETVPSAIFEKRQEISDTATETSKKVRAIAFYLPQFHEIAENNKWWGTGFTEWTNVKAATAQFKDHYQPHEPGELGYYDLAKDPNILHRQAALARTYGLSGFAFYFYWFGGKRLLETPLQRVLKDPSVDLPFCLCYANENWSRRWDGADHEILIAQNHSPEDDLAFISHIAQYMRDERYIRIDGKPLLLVYRPGLLPSARETAERWRQWCLDNGLGEIYLAYTQGFEKLPPSMFGFDAAIEFPPNNHGLTGNPNLVPPQAENFAGKVFDWRDLVKRSHHYPPAHYKLFRGVNPSWDNTARRGSRGTVLLNTSPALYQEWLSNAVADTCQRITNPQERFVFINAWNEWAEGAHLEPDQRYGYAWLEATRRAVIAGREGEIAAVTARNGAENPKPANGFSEPAAIRAAEQGALHDEADDNDVLFPQDESRTAKKKILIVIHDLFRHGAQFGALNMAKTLKERFAREVTVIAGKDGPLRAHFEAVCPVVILNEEEEQTAIANTLQGLTRDGYHHAMVNSSASGWIAPHLDRAAIRFIGLVHEMPTIVRSMGLEAGLKAFDRYGAATIFPAKTVEDQTAAFLINQRWSNAVIAPQGLYKTEGLISEDEAARVEARRDARETIAKRHALPENAIIFLGVGFGDHRKGIDLFAEWALATIKHHPTAHFIWLGDLHQDMRPVIENRLRSEGALAGRIHLPGFVAKTRDYYLSADIYVLSSREDPFPSTVLEAFACGVPAVLMRDTSGIEALSAHACIGLIDGEGADAFLETCAPWIDSRDEARKAGASGIALIRSQFGFVSYIGTLLAHLDPDYASVSAIVPGYNYEAYIEKRLTSIAAQTHPPREIIYLDDASTDDSLATARQCLAQSGINHRVLSNTTNSGNVFRQWQKGVAEAAFALCWIAEADDWADDQFIERLAPHFVKNDVVLAYSDSRQIDGNGTVIAPDYRYYVKDISPTQWEQSFRDDGIAHVCSSLSAKNAIPNVSATLMRTRPLRAVLETHLDHLQRLRTAGDWLVYVHLLQAGNLAFENTPLNYHRRHENSVTISQFTLDDLTEIAAMQAYIGEHFPITADQRARARRYLTHLIEHFDMRDQYTDTQLDAAQRGT
ncbi:MAG: glycoside hydrolase family 99-like domain-containing protein [Pseudomonadota bacterium]